MIKITIAGSKVARQKIFSQIKEVVIEFEGVYEDDRIGQTDIFIEDWNFEDATHKNCEQGDNNGK